MEEIQISKETYLFRKGDGFLIYPPTIQRCNMSLSVGGFELYEPNEDYAKFHVSLPEGWKSDIPERGELKMRINDGYMLHDKNSVPVATVTLKYIDAEKAVVLAQFLDGWETLSFDQASSEKFSDKI